VTVVVPQPSPDDVPYNDPVTRRLGTETKLTLTFRPVGSTSEFVLPTLAISKHPESSYTAWMDGEKVYGPAPIPPTDVDDLTVTFMPARRFSSKLTVEVKNLSDTTARDYSIQPVGWEEI
jgi:hypothetical protein